MDKERNYFSEFIFMWIKVFIVYCIAGYLGTALSEGIAFDRDIGLVGAAIVFGVTFFNRVIPFNLFGNHDAVIIFWVLKVLLSALIGIIAFPIVNTYYIINMLVSVFRLLKKGKRNDFDRI